MLKGNPPFNFREGQWEGCQGGCTREQLKEGEKEAESASSDTIYDNSEWFATIDSFKEQVGSQSKLGEVPDFIQVAYLCTATQPIPLR